MANELKTTAPSGLNLYAQLENAATAQVWNGSAFQTYNQSNWSSYAIPLTERAGTGKYYADMPVVAAARYVVTTFLRDGASPAWGDSLNDSTIFDWTGAAEATLTAIEAAAGTTAAASANLTIDSPEYVVGARRVPLKIAQKGKSTLAFRVKDGGGAAVDLTGRSLRFLVRQSATVGLFKIENGSSLVAGPAVNQLTVTVSAANAAAAGVFFWELWDLTADRLLACGPIEIKAALKDVT